MAWRTYQFPAMQARQYASDALRRSSDAMLFSSDALWRSSDAREYSYNAQQFSSDTQATSSDAKTASEKTQEHVHGFEHWLGSDTVDGFGGRVESMTPYTLTVGSNAYGAWTLLISSDNTPIRTGMVQYDPHRIYVSAASNASTIHRIQLVYASDSTVATARAAASDDTCVLYVAQDRKYLASPVDTLMPQALCGTASGTVFGRAWANAETTGTVSLFLGIHEYGN